MMRVFSLLMVLSMMVFLGGCGAVLLPSGELEGPISYGTSGGLMGSWDKLTVNPNGTATYSTKTSNPITFQVSSEKMDNLKKALAGSGLAWVIGTFGMEAADGFTSNIDYNGQTITIRTTIDPFPEYLTNLTRALGDIIREGEDAK